MVMTRALYRSTSLRKSIFFALVAVLSSCATPGSNEQIAQPELKINDSRVLKLIKARDSVAPFFKQMQVEDGDWLNSFPEAGQTFEEYIASNPKLPTPDRRTVYIQPIGEFTATQAKILKITADYMAVFYNLPVKLNSVRSLGNFPDEYKRRNPYSRQTQLKTGYFLEKILPEMMPKDAAALICFTNYDLFPDESMNYVFGQASLENRVGVWSIWRFGYPDTSEKGFRLFLARTLKVAMHETGHMFGMRHCTKYECLMSGTNHLGETDRRPLDVCPECMAKIAWAMGYDPEERCRKLAQFWAIQNWGDEERLFIEKADAVHIALE